MLPYSIFMEKTTCPMPDFNENNIENKTNKALRFLIEDRRRKCDRVYSANTWPIVTKLGWNDECQDLYCRSTFGST
jgi:hypothetical protein